MFVCLFFFCGWVFSLHVCLCTPCMTGTRGSQKRVSDHPKLELQSVVRCCVDAVNQIRSSRRVDNAPNY